MIYCIAHRTHSIFSNKLYWKEIWKKISRRMDICKYVTKSLCHTPETNTTLKVNYTPIYNKDCFKQKVCTLLHNNPPKKTLSSQNLILYCNSSVPSSHRNQCPPPTYTWEAERDPPSEAVCVFQRHDLHDGTNNVS